MSGASLSCIPFHGVLTDRYLDSLHRFGSAPWNEAVSSLEDDPLFSWRDGESPFLMPRGQEREKAWLEGEASSVERVHTVDLSLRYTPERSLEAHQYRSYPVHSFSAWMKEFRMLGYIHRLQEIEAGLGRLGKNAALPLAAGDQFGHPVLDREEISGGRNEGFPLGVGTHLPHAPADQTAGSRGRSICPPSNPRSGRTGCRISWHPPTLPTSAS